MSLAGRTHPYYAPTGSSKKFFLANETRTRTNLASCFSNSFIYQARYGMVETKALLDLELRARVTKIEVCTISVEKHFEK